MKAENQLILKEKCPFLYGKAMTVNPFEATEMYHPIDAFGFECGDGWFNLIMELSLKIEEYNNKNQEKVIAAQVKEKYGTLRFYVHGAPDEIYDLISEYEDKSAETCEVCGNPGRLECDRGWYRTSCEEHKKGEYFIDDDEIPSGN